jgi:hypothetical protein
VEQHDTDGKEEEKNARRIDPNVRKWCKTAETEKVGRCVAYGGQENYEICKQMLIVLLGRRAVMMENKNK